MDESALRSLLDDVRSGAIELDDALARLRRLPFADLGFARVDHHRSLRQRVGEAVYAPGKAAEHCAAIVEELLSAGGQMPVILTRADPDQVAACMEVAPEGEVTTGSSDPRLSTVAWRRRPARPDRVLVLTAGSSDLPVARECRAVLEACGFGPNLIADCGVAGVHRLFAEVDELIDADAIVVIAGMEGALPSLVAGIASAPVVAVPTSTGYGTAFAGITALLGMLSSCAAGLTVVGIDNGFGAACAVARMLP